MKIIIAGVGPSKTDLISLAAVGAAKTADLILVPRSDNKTGIAENLISQYVPADLIFAVLFPMTRDAKHRSEIIRGQLENLKSKLENSERIFFPVIGDSVLYSTAAYLVEELKKFFPNLEIEFIPGISAHSLAYVCAKKFMAMSEEIFSVIPGTAAPEKILNALKTCDTAAIYKPTALKDKKIFDFIKTKFSKIIRVDFAGLPNEKIFEGSEALENINEYLSIILLMI